MMRDPLDMLKWWPRCRSLELRVPVLGVAMALWLIDTVLMLVDLNAEQENMTLSSKNSHL